jgi:Family of unknown function (DUF6159)
MTRLRNSWELAKISWGVIRSDRSLLWIPAFGALASLVVLAVLGALFLLTGIDSDGNGAESLQPMGYVLIAVAYLAMAFVSVFFQAALVVGANARLDGRDTTVGDAVSAAGTKVHRLLPWAIVVATVSFIISQLERQEILGVIVARLIGAAWSILTFLAIPIIVIEDAGPGRALKRSKDLLGKTWGENITAQVGFGLLGFVAMLPAAAVIGIGVAIGSPVVLGVTIAVGVVWLAIVTLVLSALTGVYRTALYRYVAEGVAPAAFAGADLGHAFAPARRRERRAAGGGFSGRGFGD